MARTHGMSRLPEYKQWQGMHMRCTWKRAKSYPHYGGRGIAVCAQWQSFPEFLKDMGRRPGPGFSIERKDPNGNYEPDNCIWLPLEKQNGNRTISIRLRLNAVEMCAAEVLRELRLPKDAGFKRLRKFGVWGLYGGVTQCRPRLRNGLSIGAVRESRAALEAGTETLGQLASRFGVSKSTMWLAVTGKTWKHVPGGSL